MKSMLSFLLQLLLTILLKSMYSHNNFNTLQAASRNSKFIPGNKVGYTLVMYALLGVNLRCLQ